MMPRPLRLASLLSLRSKAARSWARPSWKRPRAVASAASISRRSSWLLSVRNKESVMDRVVLLTKPTRLDELVREYHTEGAARFALESRGQSIDSVLREHAAYAAALAEVRRQIPNDVPVTSAKRDELPHFLFREKDAIVAVGQDGLIANMAQYVGDQLVIGVN